MYSSSSMWKAIALCMSARHTRRSGVAAAKARMRIRTRGPRRSIRMTEHRSTKNTRTGCRRESLNNSTGWCARTARFDGCRREAFPFATTPLGNVELISIMLDRGERITYCNDYFLRLTGWQREQILGRNFIELFIPPDLAEELWDVKLALNANLPTAWHHENEILTHTGERRLIRWNNSVLRSGI